MQRDPLRLRFVLLLALGAWALPVAGAESASAKATVSADFVYRSPFTGYKRYSDQPVESWVVANDTVGRIGGWQAYAREAQAAMQAPVSSPAAPKQQAPAAAPSGHSTHH